MNEHKAELDRTHNIVLVMITVACLAAIIESFAQNWELWVTPLIFISVVTAWIFHLIHFGRIRFRENFYIIMSMVVAFYHGVHQTSFFDIVVISILLMVTITLLARMEYLFFSLVEFFVILIIQLVLAIRSEEFIFDALNISRILLHVLSEICIFKGLGELVRRLNRDSVQFQSIEDERQRDREKIEKFLGNIYRDLMIPVNTICEIAAKKMKSNPGEDTIATLASGMRLAWQIRDINDYSEIQRETITLEEENYSIVTLMNEYVTDYKSGVIKNNIDVIVDLDPEVPAVLRGDAYKLGKIIRLIGHNSIKFTEDGCIYFKVSGIRKEKIFNLMIEISDTGIGMSRSYLEKISKGDYYADRVHDAELGGIGLGLPIVYGFVRKMRGFVSIDSKLHQGTTVKICIPQQIIDNTPCMMISGGNFVNVAFYNMPQKYTVPQTRDYYRAMASNLAKGLRVNIYYVSSLSELQKLISESDITHVFLGTEEYEDNPEVFEELARNGMSVTVSASLGYTLENSRVQVISKPLFALPIIKILSSGKGKGGRV